MPGKLDITGYAIVSDDDKIAGADGLTPASLRNEKDWELYQRAQEVANLVVSPAAATNSNPISIGAYALSCRATRRASNNDRTAGGGARSASPGKTPPLAFCRRAASSPWAAARWCSTSFSRSASTGFTCRARMGSNCSGGRSVFSACDSGVTAASVLEQRGLKPHEDDAARSRAWRRNDDLAARTLSTAGQVEGRDDLNLGKPPVNPACSLCRAIRGSLV